MRSIPQNWSITTIQEVCSYYSGGSPIESLEYSANGIPVLAKGDVKTYGKLVHGNRFIPEDIVIQKKLRLTTPGDILLTTRDLTQAADFLGLVAPIPSNQQYVINQGGNVIRINTKIDEKFFVYWCNGPIYRKHIKTHFVGSTQIHLRKQDFLDAPLYLPPLDEQRDIADILGTLDDKIALNHRMNQALESIAKAMFQELVKGKNGVTKTIGDVITVVGGSTPSTSNSAFWDGDIHWATPKDLASLSSPVLLDTSSRITELGLQQIGSGLLPVGTVLLSSRAPIGYLAITEIPVAVNQGFIAIKCSKLAPNYFILNWLKENMEEIIGRANGTTFLEISKSNFRSMKIVLPTSEQMRLFIENVEPLYQKVVANMKESRILSSLRDLLLPKLVTGDLRVKTGN